ncbi:MAG: hypothetical protein JNL52_09780 [Flavobacteriales bacterium]|nr:hypothetical protein [Flavobacteriales bacterium]
MNIPRYWAKVQDHLMIDGQRTDHLSTFIGHSDRSEEEALQRARERVAAVQARIDNHATGHAAEYEVCIREEIVMELTKDAVITRNRYGAEVLNCARLIMIDVDKPPYQSLWAQLFKRDRRPAKERTLEHIRKIAGTMDQRTGFRIYETHSGFRVIITGIQMAPQERAVAKLFEALNSDPLYAMMCRRQDCYRARLTPKPHRIQQKPIRLVVPYDEQMRSTLGAWVQAYNERSRGFKVCRMVEVIGRDSVDDVIAYHDKRTLGDERSPLA